MTGVSLLVFGVVGMDTSFTNIVYQIVLVDQTTFVLVIVLSMVAAFAFREALDGASLTAICFFPFFILGALVSVYIFTKLQVFMSSDQPVNTVAAAICGIGIMLIILLIFKRAIIYVSDTIHRLV